MEPSILNPAIFMDINIQCPCHAHDARTCLFYGGLVNRKSILNTLMMSYISLGAVASSGFCWL